MDEFIPTHESESTPPSSVLRADMAFVAENPEAFGFVSDAFPAVTDNCLIAAAGCDGEAGLSSFTYPTAGGLAGLYGSVYTGILAPDAMADEILSHTFGTDTGRHEHPIARYVAALAEATAAQWLSDPPADASYDDVARRLGEDIPAALADLRENLCRDGLTARDADLYAVSLAVCRMKDCGNDRYDLDILVAGDFRVFLLDANGLRPLHLPPAAVLSPEGDRVPMTGKRVRLRHPSPFAILLLSGSACAANAAEAQNIRENPGLVWRYRMRREAHLLRILTSLSRESEFGDRAGQFFTGRASGRESASGAMAMRCGNASFDAFRADCLARLRHVEDMIALLPDGYDPAKVPPLPSRTETENNYIRRLITQEPRLSEQVTDALRALAMDKLHGARDESVPPPEDVPDLRRLTYEDVHAVYRVYDAENGEDYEAIRRNRAMLREQLAEHWVTLRPILLGVTDGAAEGGDGSAENRAQERAGDRTYATLLQLNARFGQLWERRRAELDTVSALLARHSGILQASGEDWLRGHTGADIAAMWADSTADELAYALQAFANTYERTEAAYRSLLTAYTAERDHLFAEDAERPGGAFADVWDALRDGRMPPEQAAAFRAAIEAGTEGERYVDMWDDLCIISRGTGARMARVRDRAADRRMARDIAARMDIRVAALRASAYRDADWGDAVCDLLDTAHRNSYFTMVRRWQETCELRTRQAAAYEEYRSLYEG